MEVSTQSKLRSVTVYRSGALVERELTLEVSDGVFPERVTVLDLPLGLEDSSVQVEAQAESGSCPTARDVRVALFRPTAPAVDAAGELVRQVREAKAQEAECQRRRKRLREELTRLNQLEFTPRTKAKAGQPPQSPPLLARLSFLDFTQERISRLRERLGEQTREHTRLQAQLELLETQLAACSADRNARPEELRKALVISLDKTTGASSGVRLIIRYLITGARWLPSYCLRLDADWQHAQLAVRAWVAQQTGEDWNRVHLKLSTALPQRWTELPALKARRLGRRQASPRRPLVPPPTGAEELFADFDRFRKELAKRDPLRSRGAEPTRGGGQGPAVAGSASDAEVELAANVLVGGPPQVRNAPPRPPIAPAPMAAPAAAATVAFGAAPAPAGEMRRLRSADLAAPAAPSVAQEEAEVTVDPSWLDFGNLRLPSPSQAQRGRVQPLKQDERYEWVSAQYVEVNLSVTQIVAWTQQQARQVERLPAPRGCTPPETHAGFDFAYPGQFEVDVPSDGAFHSLTLCEARAPARLTHVCVPSQKQHAFRRVQIDNPLQAPLLAGPVDVYVDGTFLIAGEVRLAPQGGQVELWLGVEQKLKIARNTRFQEKTSGLLRNHLALQHDIEIEVENHLPRPAAIEVRERIPTAREGDEDVRVTTHAVSPEWKPFEQEGTLLKGGRQWQLELAAGAKQVLKTSYTVEIPSKQTLVGGNRREI